jgi:glycyl-tRNA synthetase beta chain
MGGYYAAAQGEHPAVADAIRDHYKPVGQGDAVPTAPVTVAVSLADKLDTLFQFFNEDLLPTGSRDPYALRRAALGLIAMIVENQLKLPLFKFFKREQLRWRFSVRLGHMSELPRIADFAAGYSIWSDPESWDENGGDHVVKLGDEVIARFRYTISHDEKELQRRIRKPEAGPILLDFFADRLKVQQREAGVRHDLIDAVFALGGEDDLVRLLARVRALQAFVGTPDGANLLIGYKRASNILKKEGWPTSPSPRLRGEGAEETAVLHARTGGSCPRDRPRLGRTDGDRRDRARGFRNGDGRARDPPRPDRRVL